MTSSSKGTLVFKVVEGDFVRDTETFGQMDPKVEILFEGKSFETTEKPDAGKHPVWNESFDLEILETSVAIRLICKDVNPAFDDIIGEAIV